MIVQSWQLEGKVRQSENNLIVRWRLSSFSPVFVVRAEGARRYTALPEFSLGLSQSVKESRMSLDDQTSVLSHHPLSRGIQGSFCFTPISDSAPLSSEALQTVY